MDGASSSAAEDFDSGRLTAAELEFLAEDTLVEILPRFKRGVLPLVQGNFGPFVPQMPTAVPLWLAITLKRRGRCSISCPDWMRAANLETLLRAERADDAKFEVLPFHYLEIASLLLSAAEDDIEDAEKVRMLLEDIENVRRSIMYKGMCGAAANNLEVVHLDNLGAVELLPVRSFFAQALGAMYDVGGKKARAEDARNYGPGSSSRRGQAAAAGEGIGGNATSGGLPAAAASAGTLGTAGGAGGGRKLRRFR